MRTVGSVRVKAAGESKEFRLISKGATDLRLKSEPSYCMEVHVGDDVSQLNNVMFVCSEWASSKYQYRRSLPDIKVEVVTPGIFANFLTPATPLANDHSAEAEEFSIFMIGRGSFEDFAVKGYDIIGNAVASLDRKFKLTFVGSPKDEQRKIENWFCKEANIARNQLTIRGYRSRVEMKKMFCEADLIIIPSRSKGFGLVALEAISAGMSVLVSSESGLGKTLKEVEGGMIVVVNSDESVHWARRIQELFELTP